MYTVEDMEVGIYICQVFIDVYNIVMSSYIDELNAIESAKNESLKEAILKKSNSQIEQSRIKKHAFSLEYSLFIKAVLEKKELFTKLSRQARRKILNYKSYDIFLACGLCSNGSSEFDEKTFFANYKIAIKKIDELKARIEFEKMNKGRIF